MVARSTRIRTRGGGCETCGQEESEAAEEVTMWQKYMAVTNGLIASGVWVTLIWLVVTQ